MLLRMLFNCLMWNDSVMRFKGQSSRRLNSVAARTINYFKSFELKQWIECEIIKIAKFSSVSLPRMKPPKNHKALSQATTPQALIIAWWECFTWHSRLMLHIIINMFSELIVLAVSASKLDKICSRSYLASLIKTRGWERLQQFFNIPSVRMCWQHILAF